MTHHDLGDHGADLIGHDHSNNHSSNHNAQDGGRNDGGGQPDTAAPTGHGADGVNEANEASGANGASGEDEVDMAVTRGSTRSTDDHGAHRECAWCASSIRIVRRPGRPRLYCAQACRQRAYEHRHGFVHARTVRSLPGQATGDHFEHSGYERGGYAMRGRKVHALRTSVRPERGRRETLCGLLSRPAPGKWFNPYELSACEACASIVVRHPLAVGVSASNELSRLRAVILETAERRLRSDEAIDWLLAAA